MSTDRYDGHALARAWLSVSLASGRDTGRSQLDRSVLVEQFPTGVRLVATDGVLLLRSWVPTLADDDAPEPGHDEAPTATAIVIDKHKRARSLMGHVLHLVDELRKGSGYAHDDPPPEVPVRLRLGAIDENPDRPTFAGMEARFVVVELPEAERLKLGTHDGVYPSWRNLTNTPTRTTAIALSPAVLATVAKLGDYNAQRPIVWTFGGPTGPAGLHVDGAWPHVDGLVMPVRWDIDANRPREVVDAEAAQADELGDDNPGASGLSCSCWPGDPCAATTEPPTCAYCVALPAATPCPAHLFA